MGIELTSKFTIVELQTWMDGGSVTLICVNEKKREFKVDFVQNVVWEVSKSSKIPGRIYLNDKLIAQSSRLEVVLLKILENSNFESIDELERKILNEKIEYINSKDYLVDAKKVKVKER